MASTLAKGNELFLHKVLIPKIARYPRDVVFVTTAARSTVVPALFDVLTKNGVRCTKITWLTTRITQVRQFYSFDITLSGDDASANLGQIADSWNILGASCLHRIDKTSGWISAS